MAKRRGRPPKAVQQPDLIPHIDGDAVESAAPVKARKAREKRDFHRQTVLFQWALSKLGVENLSELRERFQLGPDSEEGLDKTTGRHRYFEAIVETLRTLPAGTTLPLGVLTEYEGNILDHTQALKAARARTLAGDFEWKYYQYLTLLFTEMYLDAYFTDAKGLRDEINTQIDAHNAAVGHDSIDRVNRFITMPTGDDDADPKKQLARLCFWCATGSGKTLLMHAHVRQYRFYHARAVQAVSWPTLDQIILVTPNDGLSIQHAEEFEQSGFDVVTVGEGGAGVDGLFQDQAKKSIKILSIHKFKDDHGEQTVATEAFTGTNLVLVDEGHRGAGRGEEGQWLSRRDELAKGGFCFEYSATFKEAIGNDERMTDRYARSVLIDYSYRNFYRDGYGKDFSILNLDETTEVAQQRYLTAALLLFYQQLRVWRDGGEGMKPFQIDKPLWVFVGHTVTGGSVKSVDDKEVVSDVVEVLLFIKRFLSEIKRSQELLKELLEDGFKDKDGRDLLAHRLPHVDTSGDKKALARTLHADILREVFNAPNGGSLVVQRIKSADGELALKVGEMPPFGVVNVGDPDGVAKACESRGITKVEDDTVRTSLFTGIKRNDSPINLLVGSRKFTEGWNSWRVSSLGLMRMGRGEGTQIIQLFGRGVRLRGYKTSLRRSSALAVKDMPARPKNLREVETLQVFGVKADYIHQFRDWIYDEVPEAKERQIWTLPVFETLPKKRKLKTLRLREEIDGVRLKGVGAEREAFRTLGPLVVLRPPDESNREKVWIQRHRPTVNWLPSIRGIKGADRKITDEIGEEAGLPTQSLTKVPLLFFDVDALLFGLESFKASRGFDRLHVDRKAVTDLLARDDWYTLHATDEDIRLGRYENRSQWQRMAQQLLNGYAEKFYSFVRDRWEAPYLEVAEITVDDPNMVTEYTIETNDTARDPAEVQKAIEDLKKAIGKDKLAVWSVWAKTWQTVPFGGHLYQPLLYVGKNARIRVSPVALNDGERRFVEALAKWCVGPLKGEREVYLLRNKAVTGLGFFMASNFYPDFLLWVQDGKGPQHLAFVDPKGLHHHDRNDPKIRFATDEVPRLQELVDRQKGDLSLHAFILSTTEQGNLNWTNDDGAPLSEAEFERLGVLFLKDADSAVASLMRSIQAREMLQSDR